MTEQLALGAFHYGSSKIWLNFNLSSIDQGGSLIYPFNKFYSDRI